MSTECKINLYIFTWHKVFPTRWCHRVKDSGVWRFPTWKRCGCQLKKTKWKPFQLRLKNKPEWDGVGRRVSGEGFRGCTRWREVAQGGEGFQGGTRQEHNLLSSRALVISLSSLLTEHYPEALVISLSSLLIEHYPEALVICLHSCLLREYCHPPLNPWQESRV